MDFDWPTEDDPRRRAVRAWLAEHPRPSGRELSGAGYVVPHWPEPWGLDADPVHQVIIDEELRAAGVEGPQVTNVIGVGWAAPTILVAGDDGQRRRFLPPLLSGDWRCCQLFSEPDAGSDLAALATRAERDGDEYVVNGSKIWSSGAHQSDVGILLARTDPDAPKHKGVSYFLVPMDRPGITLTPIVDMTTAHSFNATFFDDVRIPVDHRIGAEGEGWRLAKVTLANERVSLSSAGSLWGAGPSAEQLVAQIVGAGGLDDPRLRQRAARLWCDAQVLRLNRLRTLSARLHGRTPGPEASIQKILGDEHGQDVMGLAKDLAGADGTLVGSGVAGEVPARMQRGITEVRFPRGPDSRFPDVDPIWHYGFVASPALTLGGGTFAVQRNIVAEQVLGLDREPDVERGLSWAESRRRG